MPAHARTRQAHAADHLRVSHIAGCRTIQVAAPHCRSMARASDTCDT